MFFAHFSTISDNPLKFVIWILTSIVLSLSSFWLPSIIGIIFGIDIYSRLMAAGAFISFCIVFLSNVLFSSISYSGLNKNDNATGIRTISLILIVLILIFLSALTSFYYLSSYSIANYIQYIILTITIFMGIYAYGFRDHNWEKSVDVTREQEEKNIKDITNNANTLDSVDGVAL